ncbi:c-type cytochrome [Luteimonas terricola]|uniref:Cytochrome c biogenesis protein CcsA n=1 Tax=Luteimonas terricola TaxID=645597 RepID=A0ABQ2EG56_9GAMM|nr:cytochrome c [Luteimonas terricola]GGK06694.1 cytochrome c biogenesis protein CcsA [Luteimonas terricola]
MKTSALGLAAALGASLLLVACGGAPAEPGTALAQTANALPTGRIADGELKANEKGAATGQSCIDCHGADGNSPLDPTYPKLGGQYRDYLAQSLQAYRSGERDHALMSSQARDLDDQQIADLAAYFASQPAQIRDLHGVHSIN